MKKKYASIFVSVDITRVFSYTLINLILIDILTLIPQAVDLSFEYQTFGYLLYFDKNCSQYIEHPSFLK